MSAAASPIGVHHVRVVLDRGAVGADALALVVQVRGQRALGDADRRPSVMPSGNIVDHGIRYSVLVMPASRWAVPSITFVASIVR